MFLAIYLSTQIQPSSFTELMESQALIKQKSNVFKEHYKDSQKRFELRVEEKQITQGNEYQSFLSDIKENMAMAIDIPQNQPGQHSKMPLGISNSQIHGNNYYDYIVKGNSAVIRLRIISFYERSGAISKPKSREIEWMKEFAESATRWAIAEAEVTSFTSTAITKNGISYSGLKDRGNRKYIPLNDWAIKNEISLNWNTSQARVSFSKNGQLNIFTLGANSFKQGSQWKPMNGIVVAKNKTFYVPSDSLN